MRILSWNVNGIRSVCEKGFRDWLASSEATIVGLQEVRAPRAEVEKCLADLDGWHMEVEAAERKGYSGTALLSRSRPDVYQASLGDATLDCEGRLNLARFGPLWVANVYFPNGSGKERDNSRVPYKLAFYRALFDLLEPRRAAGEPILVMGDFNTAHKELDLARPRDNRKTSGFLPEECAELERWIQSGWTDTFRLFHPEPGQYTWWSNRPGVREKNVGWRIDYVLASPGIVSKVRRAFILPEVRGSDHCPVGVELEALESPGS